MNVLASADGTRRQADGFLVISVDVPDIEERRDVDIAFGGLRSYCGEQDERSLDFLLVASVCYVVDKTVPRKAFADRWTRELAVQIPVSDPAAWNGVAPKLAKTLSFLTGDLWDFNFTQLKAPHWARPRRLRAEAGFKADAVCLFSGGLDSLVGAINLLVERPDDKILLIGHYDSGAAAQTYLFERIKRDFPGRAKLLRVRVGHKPGSARESTLRSRSLVFLALGYYASRYFGSTAPLFACENGAIALNVPLTRSRQGSCSTRTMHPHFLLSLQDMLHDLGVTNPLFTPLEFQTKGECLEGCGRPDLLKDIAALSVSCSHPTRRQDWIRKDANCCGYCFPCLFRRASMHKIGADMGRDYGIDVCAGELSPTDPRKTASDLRAMVDFLGSGYGPEDIADEILIAADVTELRERAEMVYRAFEEVRLLFSEKGGRQLIQLSSGAAKPIAT